MTQASQNSSPILEKIDGLVKKDKVVLFMKGNKTFPMCGFSAAVVQVLNNLGVDYADYNILEDEELRQGVKDYTNWPTIPQLYINGEFIGGCDITKEMFASGELQELLK
jgi:monothiol glutaredoxin